MLQVRYRLKILVIAIFMYLIFCGISNHFLYTSENTKVAPSRTIINKTNFRYKLLDQPQNTIREIKIIPNLETSDKDTDIKMSNETDVTNSDKSTKFSAPGKLNWHQIFSIEKGVKNMTIAGAAFLVTRSTAQQVHQLISEDFLKQFRPWAVKKQREYLQAELQDFKPLEAESNLEDLIMEEGGQPVRNILFTTWRSGSTFVGEILDHHPGTYYHYEPLHHFNITQVRSGKLGEQALQNIRDMLYCSYDNLNGSIENARKNPWTYFFNHRLWQFCEKRSEICWDTHFLSSMCKLFPYQAMKTVRLRLKFAKLLMDDPSLNVRILLLVRDPRGTMQSRLGKGVGFCITEDCFDPALLCSDLVEDYDAAEMLYKTYPGRFMALRYEDFSINPLSATKKIYKFFRLQYNQNIQDFVHLHTNKDDSQNIFTTFRNSTAAAFHWKTEFLHNFTAVAKLQNICSNAMQLWGYAPALNKNHLATFNPLTNPPWSDMEIPK